jgi:uncharacterized protein YdhG (YjbR/CyaY superfamily)
LKSANNGPGSPEVDAYLAGQPDKTRRALDQLRALIREAAPGVTELMNYRIPAFALVPGGKRDAQIMIAGYAGHVGFYPSPEVIESFAGRLADYKFSKGAIQFPLDRPIPAELVLEMVRFRLRQLTR